MAFKTTSRRPANHLREELQDWSQPEPAVATQPQEPTTFRLVAVSQVYENYGAHCWDGEGECPQHWKAKGGSEYHAALGTASEVLALGSAGIEATLQRMLAKFTRTDEYWQEYLIDWQVVPTTEETYEEKELREMLEWGWITPEQHASRVHRMQLDV